MSNFNYDAYREVYPEKAPAPVIESAVEGLNLTEEAEARKATDDMPGESALPEEIPEESAEEPEGEST